MAQDLSTQESTRTSQRTRRRDLFSPDRWKEIGEALGLSRREFQIVQCIFDGQKEATIGAELGISAHTVHTHVKRLYRKLTVSDHCELAIRVFAEYLSIHEGGERAEDRTRAGAMAMG